MDEKTILGIDGDVLCYYACEKRYKVSQDGILRIPLTHTGERVQLEYTEEEDRFYMETVWYNFQTSLNDLQEKLFCKDYVMAVKGPGNFRDLLYPEYKINRHSSDPTRRNLFVPALRKAAVAHGLAVASDGREADDLLRIWANEAKGAGVKFITCTIDKDLKCIPGMFYDMKHETLIEITEAMATRHYYEQMLKGDPVDNIPGVPGIGNVKAEKILKSLQTEEEFQEAVVSHYIAAYDDEWFNQFLSNAKMIHLQRNPNDYFKASEWPILRELVNA